MPRRPTAVSSPRQPAQRWSSQAADIESGATGTSLKEPLVVQVNDDQGTAVVGALVEFHGPAGVSFQPAAALTDSSGQVTTAVTLGNIAGHYQILAITPGKTKQVSLEVVETALGAQQRLGAILNDNYCSRCHDPESSPERVSNFDNLEVKPHPFTDGATLNKMSDADLTSIIQHGGPALNRSALMPALWEYAEWRRREGSDRLRARCLRPSV